jgi:hypothetical protein
MERDGSDNRLREVQRTLPRLFSNMGSYLDSKSWSQDRLLDGANGIAALTFCEVPISPAKPARSRRSRKSVSFRQGCRISKFRLASGW